MDPIEEIRQLYFQATAQTIQRDVDRAIDLLKSLPDEASRERAAVYMDGLAQMRSEWQGRAESGPGRRGAKPGAARSGPARSGTAKPTAGKPGAGNTDVGKPRSGKPRTGRPDTADLRATRPAGTRPDTPKKPR